MILPETCNATTQPAIGIGSTAAASSSRSLRLNFAWTLASNIVYGSTQWGILVLLARLGTPEAVGQFSLGLAITAPIMLFASLQLRVVLATDTCRTFQFRDYAGLRVLTTLAAACLVLTISTLLYQGEAALTIVAIGITKAIESMSDIVYGVWQHQERMDLIAKSIMLRGMLALLAAAINFAVFHTVWIAVCGMAAAWAIVFAFFDIPHGTAIVREMGQVALPRFSVSRMRPLASLSLPLGFVSMLISFNANVPRYMISHFRSVRELGLFSALGYVIMVGTMIIGALGQSAIPRLALYASQSKTGEFRRLSNRLLLIGMALGLLGVLTALAFGRQLIAAIYGSEYAQNLQVLVWLTVAAACGYMASFGGCCLTAARHFRIQLPLFTVVTGLTIVLCYVAVRDSGALGAAKVLAIVAFVQLVATLAIVRRLEGSRPPNTL